MNIVFMADGTDKIGFGHIKRCLYLAEEMKNGKISFLVNAQSKNFVKDYRKFLVKNEFNKIDIEEIRKILSVENPDIIILSSELITQESINIIKMFCRMLVFIDDISLNTGDLTFNFNSFAKDLSYKEKNVFLGLDYLFIKKVFISYHKKNKKISKKCNNILLSFGTSDPMDMTEKVLDAIKDMNVEVTTVSNKNINTKRKLLSNVDNMEKLLYNSDLAIISGGLTIYESACVGTPALVFCQSENQIKNVENMKGLTLDVCNTNMSDFNENLNSLMKDSKKRRLFSKNGKNLIDCKGLSRSYKIIYKNYSELPSLRKVSEKDSKKIWSWRNDPETRKNSFNTDEIDYQSHKKWLSEILSNKNIEMFISEINTNDIGVVRIDKTNGEIHINMNPIFRNKGYGKKTLRVVIPYIFNNLKLNSAIARIKVENEASIHIFEALGFKAESKNKEVLMKLSLN